MMNKNTKHFTMQGGAGLMEGLLDLPLDGKKPRGIALVAHPHPLYGGTMENKVTQTLARAFVALDYAVARINFRGVGQSEGEHDRGHGETDDMELLYHHMVEKFPDLPVALAGFSFGTYVQSHLAQRLVSAQRREDGGQGPRTKSEGVIKTTIDARIQDAAERMAAQERGWFLIRARPKTIWSFRVTGIRDAARVWTPCSCRATHALRNL